MTMQRRHYELIAEAIAEARVGLGPDNSVGADDLTIRRVVDRLSRKLRTDNPSFNPSRFLKACGVEEGQ